MDKKFIRFVQMLAEKETDIILEEVNSDPAVENRTVPDDLQESILAQIQEHEAEKMRVGLTEEEQELIELGKVYKRRKKWNKWIAVAAVMVFVMMLGVTSMGGPEKALEKLTRTLAGKEQTYYNSESERTEEIEDASEDEAYRQIEEKFGFFPVRLDCLPEGIKFKESTLSEDSQSAYMIYEQDGKDKIVCIMWTNHRITSTGNDIEDVLIKEYKKQTEKAEFSIKYYQVESTQECRWTVEFEYQNIYYFMYIWEMSEENVEKILDNLYFS